MKLLRKRRILTTQYLFAILLLFMFSSVAKAGCKYAEPMKAKELDMGVLITWTTTEEYATDYFAIFRSTDGIEFEQIGEESAMGDSRQKTDYRFLDTSLGAERIFYRLMLVDIDGTQSYTHISVVNRKKPNHFKVTLMGSTITDRFFNIVFQAEMEGHMSYRLENFEGEVKKRGVIRIEKGQNLFTLDLEDEEAGKYFFKFKMKDEEEMLVLIKSNGDILATKK